MLSAGSRSTTAMTSAPATTAAASPREVVVPGTRAHSNLRRPVSRRALIQEVVEELAAMDRPSASDGERRAAERLAARLRDLGAPARLESERAHGGFWWPIALANLLAALATFLPGPLRVLVAGIAAAAVHDDTTGGRQWWRRPLQRRETTNVVAELGDPAADRVAVVVAHHDAAHSSVIYDPAPARAIGERFADRLAEADRTLPIMWTTIAAPLLAVLGLRRTARAWAAGVCAVMADIGRHPAVPGANDNLAAVGVVAATAAALRERPVEGLRIVLLSTGAEESFSEGMQGFVRRHRDGHVLALECVGSPLLCLVEGEGMMAMRDYPASERDLVARAAEDAGVQLHRGLRTVAASDAVVTLHRGIPSAMIGGVDPATWFPANYHWPTDVPENLDWDRVEDCAAVVEAWLRRLAAS